MRGVEAEQISGEKRPEISISATYDKELSQENYHLVEVYFLNNNEDWQRIKKVQIVEVPGVEEFHVIEENDLNAWKKSMLLDYQLKKEKAVKDKTELPSPEIEVKLSNLIPENSISAPLSLPGKLQVGRWALIQTPRKNKIKNIFLEITFIDSAVVKYKLNIEGKSL